MLEHWLNVLFQIIFQQSTAQALRAPSQITWPTACSLVGWESLALWWCLNARQDTIWVWGIGLFAALPMGRGRGQMTQLHARVSINTNINTFMTVFWKICLDCYCQIYYSPLSLWNKITKTPLWFFYLFCVLVYRPLFTLDIHIYLCTFVLCTNYFLLFMMSVFTVNSFYVWGWDTL